MTTDTLREAVARAIRAAFDDETDGAPAGNIINIGCEGASYRDPGNAANRFLDSATDAALAAIEAAGWRVVKARTTTGVTVAPYGDEIVVLLEEDNDIASAILDVSYATELRDGLTEVLAAPRIAEKE